MGYFSKKLSPAYTVELECLAVVRGVEHFEVYKQFVTQTDHHALPNFTNIASFEWSPHSLGSMSTSVFVLNTVSAWDETPNADGLSRQAWPGGEQYLKNHDELQTVEDDSDLKEREMSGSPLT